MNSPPSASVPELSNVFTLGNFGSLNNVVEDSPKPYDSPRVPRARSRLPLFSFPRANRYNKISSHPKSSPHRTPPTTDDDYFRDHRDHSPHQNNDPSQENFNDSLEDYPKNSHLRNSGVHHSPPKEYSHFGGGFRGGFGRTSGFATGLRGQGWGDWVW